MQLTCVINFHGNICEKGNYLETGPKKMGLDPKFDVKGYL